MVALTNPRVVLWVFREARKDYIVTIYVRHLNLCERYAEQEKDCEYTTYITLNIKSV